MHSTDFCLPYHTHHAVLRSNLKWSSSGARNMAGARHIVWVSWSNTKCPVSCGADTVRYQVAMMFVQSSVISSLTGERVWRANMYGERSSMTIAR